MTKTLYLKATSPGHIERAAQLLLQGKLVAFPTETVYGLGGLALDESVVAGIFEAKSRPRSNPLILHVGDVAAASELFDFKGSQFESKFFARFEQLSKLFWPGPLTLVGKKASFIPDSVTGGFPKVAVRIPSCPTALQLLKNVGQPIAAPSANLSTRPSPTACRHVVDNLDNRVDAILDGGQTEFGIESTVIDIDAESPKILRFGAITHADLSHVLMDLKLASVGQVQLEASPGTGFRHYSPNISQVLLASEGELAKAWFSSSGIILRSLTHQRLCRLLGERPLGCGPVRTLADDSKGCAKELFVVFYEMESMNLNQLLMEDLTYLSNQSEWAAVCDRLFRAENILPAHH